VTVPKGIPLQYLTEEVLIAALIFDPDMAEIPTGINTLDNPILPRAYEQGWQAWD